MTDDATATGRRRDDGGDRPALDDVFDALAAGRRRVVLSALRRRGEADVARLAALVAAAERDGPGDEPDRRDVALSLRHNHLPRLDAAGAVDYDPAAGRARYEGGEELEAWLDRVGEATGR